MCDYITDIRSSSIQNGTESRLVAATSACEAALQSYLAGEPPSNNPDVFHDIIQQQCGMKVNDSDRLSFADTGGKQGLGRFLRLAKVLRTTTSTPDTQHAFFFLRRLAERVVLDAGLCSNSNNLDQGAEASPTGPFQAQREDDVNSIAFR